jgi:hypothetical protein
MPTPTTVQSLCTLLKSENPISVLISFGMFIVAMIALFFAYESAEYARISAETARASVRLQSAQLQPQLDYPVGPISLRSNFLTFNISIRNLGPRTAVIKSYWLILQNENGTIIYDPFFENAVIANGASREMNIAIPNIQKLGEKTVSLFDKFKTDGVSIEVRYSAVGVPDETYFDDRKITTTIR